MRWLIGEGAALTPMDTDSRLSINSKTNVIVIRERERAREGKAWVCICDWFRIHVDWNWMEGLARIVQV
jgi:hypothetical protein